MPKVPAMLEEITGKKAYRGLSPHTAVAQGAAIHAAILEAKFRGAGSELAEKVRKHLSRRQAGKRQLPRPGRRRPQSQDGQERQPRDDSAQLAAADRAAGRCSTLRTMASGA